MRGARTHPDEVVAEADKVAPVGVDARVVQLHAHGPVEQAVLLHAQRVEALAEEDGGDHGDEEAARPLGRQRGVLAREGHEAHGGAQGGACCAAGKRYEECPESSSINLTYR